MSLFVAALPSEDAVAHLDDALERVRRDPVAHALHWQTPGRWHVTLAFLGEVGEQRADDICEALDAVGRSHGPIGPLRLSGAGVFGRQVLWICIDAADDIMSEPLAGLAAHIGSAMRRLRIPMERKPWQPHLTIARSRNGDPSAAERALSGYRGPEWTAEHVDLIRSDGGPRPTHHLLHSTLLTGG